METSCFTSWVEFSTSVKRSVTAPVGSSGNGITSLQADYASSRSFVTVVQLRDVPGAFASSFHIFERAMPAGCQA